MEHDTKTEANLEKAWQKLSESFIPRENLIPSDTFGNSEDGEDTPQMIAQRDQIEYKEAISDINYFLKNVMYELEDTIETQHPKNMQLWNDVKYKLRLIQEEYAKKMQ